MKRTPLSRGTKPLKRKTRLKVTPSIWKWPPKELSQKRSKGKPTHYSKPEKRPCKDCGGFGTVGAYWDENRELVCTACSGQGFAMYRRLILSAADWQQMKRELWAKGSVGVMTGCYMYCGICGEIIRRFEDMEPDNIQPRGMGGGKRDDSPSNIQPSHRACNREKGSKSVVPKEAERA